MFPHGRDDNNPGQIATPARSANVYELADLAGKESALAQQMRQGADGLATIENTVTQR